MNYVRLQLINEKLVMTLAVGDMIVKHLITKEEYERASSFYGCLRYHRNKIWKMILDYMEAYPETKVNLIAPQV